jgi:hypothetical protein
LNPAHRQGDYYQALLRHVRRAKVATIVALADDIVTWTMLMAANA